MALRAANGCVNVGWVQGPRRTDDADFQVNEDDDEYGPGDAASVSSGAVYSHFGAPSTRRYLAQAMEADWKSGCSVGCLLDLDAGTMTVFADDQPLAVADFAFTRDREWLPTVGLGCAGQTVQSVAL